MSTRTVFLMGYLLVGLAFLACWLASRRTVRVARLDEVVRVVMRSNAGRLFLILVWWWIGFHVLARSAVPEP